MKSKLFTYQTNWKVAPKEIAHPGTQSVQPLLTLKSLLLLLLLLFAFLHPFRSSAQCAMACNNNLQVALGSSCTATITYDMILEDPDNPQVCFPNGPANYLVQVYNSNGTQILPTSPNVTAANIGQTLMVRVKHVPSGNYCWGTITVKDKMAPLMTCPANVTVVCGTATAPASTGNPTVSDCSTYTTTFVDQATNTDCSNPLSVITRTWTATDAYNNSSICNQTITVVPLNVNDIVFPLNRDNMQAPALSCTNPNTNPNNTGRPTVNGQPLISGACNIVYTYSDQTIPLCGGSYKILRTWTILNWCNSQITTHVQIIKVEDSVAPTIACPSNLTVGTTGDQCAASFLLPGATVSDNCSAWTVTITGGGQTVNGNGGGIDNLPVGQTVFTYRATDACGNSKSCSMNVTVVDDDTPIAICDAFTVASLGTDGLAQVYAATFDDGSYDNCCLHPDMPFQVRRMGQPNSAFGPYVEFNCADAGTSVNVIMRVRDCHNNTNTCMVVVDVQDKLNPVIACPADATVACGTDLSNLNTFGNPTVWDNCPGYTVTSTSSTTINNCGVGVVKRTFTVTDASGRTDRCTQQIHVINADPFNGNDITWPLDYTVTTCTSVNNLDPDDLSAPYSHPVFNDTQCDLAATNYTDELFTIAPPACFKILRHWTIIDWCQYEANGTNPVGIWTHTQIIKVFDNEPPVLTIPADLTLNSTQASCGSATVQIPVATATDCNPNVTITNNHNNGGANASGIYSYGTTVVTFSATDGCGNLTHKTMTVTVTDGKKPTPICINGLATTLMQTGMVMVNVKQFNINSSDNCTAAANLRYSYSSNLADTIRIFDCDDYQNQPTQIVQMWVTDEAGNQDYCETYILIQDNMNACGPQAANIAGAIETEGGEHVEQVTVTVAGGSNAIPQITGLTGSYAFPSLPLGTAYTVTPAKDMNPLNGVSTYDLVLLQRQILGSQLLDSPYKIIAADVNKSGSITAADLVELRKLILNINTDFPDNTSWRFVDKDFVFPNMANPFQTDFPEAKNIGNLSADMNADFVAIKIGDLNGSVAPNSLTGSGSRNASGTLKLLAKDRRFVAGDVISVPVLAKGFQQLAGMQFTLSFDPEKAQWQGIGAGALEVTEGQHTGLRYLDEGFVTFSWSGAEGRTIADGTVLFEIQFRCLADGQLSELVHMGSAYTKAEAYGEDGEPMDLSLAFEGMEQEAMQLPFELYQNQPNPFQGVTTIGFSLPEEQEATLQVYDVSGRLVKVMRDRYGKGYHEIRLMPGDLPANGVYFYRLEAGEYQATKRMDKL